MKRYLYPSCIVLFSLLIAVGCRTRRGGKTGSTSYDTSSSSGKYANSGNIGGGTGSGFDPSGVINLDGTALADWTFEGGYNESGQYVGPGGLYDSKGKFVGDVGGYDRSGQFVGEKGMFNSKGEWMGPGGGYDKNGNFVGIGGMYDRNGKYVGLTNPNPGASGLLPPPARMDRRRSITSNTRTTPGVQLGIRPIYFGYDQDSIPLSEYRSMDAVVQKLASTGGRVLIEGHCDERGSKAYNLGLGDRRAQAVRTYLISQGVDPGRIDTTSYGSEQPANPGHNESAWRMNRRVEFQFD